ncbi:unnamed protein product, partial [marine sediment metagenome]
MRSGTGARVRCAGPARSLLWERSDRGFRSLFLKDGAWQPVPNQVGPGTSSTITPRPLLLLEGLLATAPEFGSVPTAPPASREGDLPAESLQPWGEMWERYVY